MDAVSNTSEGPRSLESQGFTVLSQGAEAVVWRGRYLGLPAIVKERVVKRYRQPALDASLADSRARAEARALLRCARAGLRVPGLLLVDLPRRRLYMQDMPGEKLRDSETEPQEYSGVLGEALSRMHAADVVHGDLTPCNVLVQPCTPPSVALIDFGLAGVSASVEDKAVDLQVLQRSLEGSSSLRAAWPLVLASYASTGGRPAQLVLSRLKQVQERGRKRNMVG